MTRIRGAARVIGSLPGALVALLPSAHCPLCLGAYGAVVSALGLGVLVSERMLAPLVALTLAAGIATVAWTSRSHGRRGPLMWTLAGSAAIAAGRLLWNVPLLVYAGGAAVLAASIWNLWLKRPRPEPLVQLRVTHEREESK